MDFLGFFYKQSWLLWLGLYISPYYLRPVMFIRLLELNCVADAITELELNRAHTAKLLAAWHKQGVIRCVTCGL